MGRIINPDHFYVGTGTAGSGVSKTGRFDSDHARLAQETARLHRAAPHRDRPPSVPAAHKPHVEPFVAESPVTVPIQRVVTLERTGFWRALVVAIATGAVLAGLYRRIRA